MPHVSNVGKLICQPSESSVGGGGYESKSVVPIFLH